MICTAVFMIRVLYLLDYYREISFCYLTKMACVILKIIVNLQSKRLLYGKIKK